MKKHTNKTTKSASASKSAKTVKKRDSTKVGKKDRKEIRRKS
jgi:hypothetical protein